MVSWVGWTQPRIIHSDRLLGLFVAKYTRHGNDLNKSLKQNVKDANKLKKQYKSMGSSIDLKAKETYKGKPVTFIGGISLNVKKGQKPPKMKSYPIQKPIKDPPSRRR